MADTFLVDAISRLRDENKKQSDDAMTVGFIQADSLDDLNKSMGELVSQFKKGALDDEEARRDNNKKSPADAPSAPSAPEDPQAGDLKGILQILGGIGASIAGFAAGLVAGFAGVFRSIILKFTPKALQLKMAGIAKSITNFAKGLSTKFKTAFKGLFKASTNMTRIMDNLKDAFVAGTKGIKGISLTAKATLRGLNPIEKGMKLLGKVFSMFTKAFDAMKGIAKPFTSIIDKIKGAMKVSKGVGAIFGKLFGVFKTFGRVIAFPITIIMGIVDGFKGMLKGAERQEGMISTLIGGALGAISGVIQGLIGMPLDLLKDAVSWIAGKLGFENFSAILDNFSFTESIGSIFNSITDGIVDFKDRIIIQLSSAFTAIAEPLMALFNGEGSIIGNIGTFLKESISAIIGAPFDLLRSAFASILEMFGMDDEAKMFDEFNISEEISKVIDKVVEVFTNFFKRVADFEFKSLIPDWATNLFGGDDEEKAPAAIEKEKASREDVEPEIEKEKPAKRTGRKTQADRDAYAKRKAQRAADRAEKLKPQEPNKLPSEMKIAERPSDKSPTAVPTKASEQNSQQLAEANKESSALKGSGQTSVVVAAPTTNTTNNSSGTAFVGDQNQSTIDRSDPATDMNYMGAAW